MTAARSAIAEQAFRHIVRTRLPLASIALLAGFWLTPISAALAQNTLTRVEEFSYDSATGLVIQHVSEPDNPAIALTTAVTYDGFGHQLTSTVSGPDISPRTTSATYTTDGRFVATATNALSHTESHVTEPAFGNTTSLTGPNGLTTTWEYDGLGRKTREVRADGTETRWIYELCEIQCPASATYLVSAQDFITSQGTPTTAKVIDYLDKLNRVFRSESEGFDGTPVYVGTVYNARGLVEKVSKPYFQGTAPEDILWTAYTYDVVGRLTSVTLPDGGVESTTFDGLTTTVTNAMNQTSSRVVNALGELVSATDNLGYTTTYKYDPFGNLTETDAEGVVASMTYDIRGLKTAINDPDMGQWTYAYNALGEMVSQTDGKSQTITMAYDALGRMVSRTEAEGTTTWTYDTATKGIGKIASVAAPSINYAESMVYDGLGRPSVASLTFEGETYDTQTFYDAAGRADSLAYPSGFLVKSVFTANGHLAAVTDEFATTTYWQADTVNAEGQVTAETLGNGVTTARVYDPATSRIDSILTTAGATTVQDLGFDLDTLGNLTARQDLRQDREEAFTYDGLNRVTATLLTDTSTLATLNTTTYSYDSLGNIQTKSDVAGTYVYGLSGAGPHAVSQIGSKIYSYDANGSMVSGDNKTTGWTSFNKPQVITDTLNSNESLFVYGPSRARVKHRITDGGLVTNLFYVGSHFERKVRSGEDDELVHYIRAGGAVVAIYTEYRDAFDAVTGDKTRYLHRDHLGSVESITDETGAVTERFSYDPHGKRRETDWTAAVATISGTETPRGFTGHEHLDAVGLIHMNGRVYDPTLGRFLSADPFVQYPETTQGFNRYSYTDNNPLSYTDPSGFTTTKNGDQLVELNVEITKGWIDGGELHIDGDLVLYPGDGTPPNVVYDVYVSGDVYVIGEGGSGYASSTLKSFRNIYFFDQPAEVPNNTQTIASAITARSNAASTSNAQSGSLSPPPVSVSTPSQSEASSSAARKQALATLHSVFSVASFAPSIVGSFFTVADAALYAIEGDYTTAAMNVGIAGAGLFASAGAIKLATVAGKRLIKAANRAEAANSAVPQVLRSQAAGNAARDAIAAARPGSLIEQNFRVTGGLRRVDVLDGVTAIESKVGRTSLTAPVRQELARDIKMLRSGQVDAVQWHFSPSPTTGLGGPTGPLRAKLGKFGIPIVE